MPRRPKGPRIRGPYEHGDGWRCYECQAPGVGEWSPTFRTEAEAEAYKEGWTATYESGELTTEMALEVYEQHLVLKGNKPASRKHTMNAIRKLYPMPVPLWSIRARGPLGLEQRYFKLSGGKLPEGHDWPKGLEKLTPYKAVDSHRNALAETKTFFRWCNNPKRWLQDAALEDLCKVTGIGKRKKGKRKFTRKEGRLWWAAAEALAWERDEGAMATLLACAMGLRAGEVVRLYKRDLDEQDEPCDTVWVVDAKTEAGRRQDEVEESIIPLLQNYVEGLAEDAPLFPARLKHGKDWEGLHDPGWLIDEVHRVCDIAKVPHITAHGLRGTFATWALRTGAPGVKEYIGHKDERTTDGYAEKGARAFGQRKRALRIIKGGRG